MLNLGSLPDKNSTFLACGGDSFKAIKLMQWIEDFFSVKHNAIMEYILMKTFAETCQFLCNEIQVMSHINTTTQLPISGEIIHSPAMKRKLEIDLPANKKKQKSQSKSTIDPSNITTCIECGAIQVTVGETRICNPETISISRGPRCCVSPGALSEHVGATTSGSMNCSERLLTPEVQQVGSISNKEVSLSLLWKYNTGKCVDASPLVVMDG